MKTLKPGGGSGRGRKAKSHESLVRPLPQPQLPASDDDLDDILPAPAIAAGSNAYDALLGGLDNFALSIRAEIKAKAPKVKTQTASAVGAQQRAQLYNTPPELDESIHAASSSDGDDGRSEVGPEEPQTPTTVAAGVTADFFRQHFDDNAAEAGGVQHIDKSTVAWTEDSQAYSPWPATSWLTTGSSIPQVIAHASFNGRCHG